MADLEPCLESVAEEDQHGCAVQRGRHVVAADEVQLLRNPAVASWQSEPVLALVAEAVDHVDKARHTDLPAYAAAGYCVGGSYLDDHTDHPPAEAHMELLAYLQEQHQLDHRYVWRRLKLQGRRISPSTAPPESDQRSMWQYGPHRLHPVRPKNAQSKVVSTSQTHSDEHLMLLESRVYERPTCQLWIR